MRHQESELDWSGAAHLRIPQGSSHRAEAAARVRVKRRGRRCDPIARVYSPHGEDSESRSDRGIVPLLRLTQSLNPRSAHLRGSGGAPRDPERHLPLKRQGSRRCCGTQARRLHAAPSADVRQPGPAAEAEPATPDSPRSSIRSHHRFQMILRRLQATPLRRCTSAVLCF